MTWGAQNGPPYPTRRASAEPWRFASVAVTYEARNGAYPV